ncbi:tetratricopeptide repeat protein [Colwellia sp. D2M02]|uniref:tetratricopeptide repeat protein n=1 Tax=Colwellia sp. D2M02 TaxID=2841562 RepID=UPI001C091024|nr:tetratricopeptide repeat protein [Colwellia sp. D2M02]MBU2893036.1 tetratricopeptide repeat protein [Colwellia sp. D2M02]
MLKVTHKLFISISLLSIVFTTNTIASSNITDLKITLAKPTFVLPAFSGPYSEREATIAPEEYETAERLKTLLDNGQEAEVLKELEGYYDLELSPAMLTLKAQIYFSLKQFTKAEKTFLAVLSRKPQLVRVHRDLGQLYLIQEQYKLARHHFSEAIAFGSNDAMVHGQLAYLNLKLYGAFSAITSYQQAMALQPEEVQWQQGLLIALSEAKMYESAQALLAQLIEKNPADKELWLNQAVLAIDSNNMKQALASIEMAILLGDDTGNNLKTAAQLHLQMHSYDRALVLISQHLDKSALDMVMLNEYLIWLKQARMWQQADKLLVNLADKVNKMSVNEQSIYFNHKATIANQNKQYQKAKNYYQTALEKNPTNGDALINFAFFSVEREDFIIAELLFNRAEVLPAKAKQALLGKAQLYLDKQEHQAALSVLQKAYGRFPDLHYLPEQMQIIKSIIRTESKTTS